MRIVVCGKIRIAEGEQEPEGVTTGPYDGWRVYVHPHGLPFYYRRQKDARAAQKALQEGKRPEGGGRFWSPATVFLA